MMREEKQTKKGFEHDGHDGGAERGAERSKEEERRRDEKGKERSREEQRRGENEKLQDREVAERESRRRERRGGGAGGGEEESAGGAGKRSECSGRAREGEREVSAEEERTQQERKVEAHEE